MMAAIRLEVWEQSAMQRDKVTLRGVRRTEEFEPDELAHGGGRGADFARLATKRSWVGFQKRRAKAHDQRRGGDNKDGGDR